MSTADCIHEETVRRAVARGPLAGELAAHAAACPICGGTVAFAGLLRELEAATPGRPRLPSASFLWWKAELERKRQAEARALRPLAWTQAVASAAGAGGLGLWAFLSWRQLHAWLAPAGLLEPVFYAGAAVLAVTLLLTYRLFSPLRGTASAGRS